MKQSDPDYSSFEIFPIDAQEWVNFSAAVQRILNCEIVESLFIYRDEILDEIAIRQWFLSLVHQDGITLVCKSRAARKF